jgi:type II secretion system protein C
VKAIQQAHLFGLEPRAGMVENETHAAARTALSLTGTIALTDDPQAGGAIILQQGSRASALYVVGDEVPGGATLSAVYADHVVLRRQGFEETLELPRSLIPGIARVAGLAAPANRDDGSLVLADPAPGELAPTIEPPPSLVTSALRVTALVMDKHLMGYSVVPDSKLSIPGLNPHDIVTEINGVRLDNGETAGRMFDSLSSGGTAVLTVRAGDDLVQRTVDLSDLPAAIAPRPKKARPASN